MSAPTGWRKLRETLAEPNYRRFTIGNIASLTGTWLQRVTVGWVTWELTSSEAWLGLIAFADLFPIVLIAPIAGVAADRSDRLRVTKISQLLLSVQAGVLFLVTALGLINIWILAGLTLFGGIVTGFNQPARMALLPSLVEKHRLGTAVALNSIVFNLARFIGPMLAGLLLTFGNSSLAFLVNAVTFAAFFLLLRRVRIAAVGPIARPQEGLLSSLGELWRCIRGSKGLAGMFLVLTVISVCIRPVLELLPSLADQLGLGVGGFALLTSVIGLGAMVGGVWLAFYGSPRLLAWLALFNGFALGGALLSCILVPNLQVASAALFLLGAGMVISGIASQTIIQLAIDDRMRGRALALHTVIFRGGPAVGALVIGVCAEFVGLLPALGTGGALAVLLNIGIWRHRGEILKSLQV